MILMINDDTLRYIQINEQTNEVTRLQNALPRRTSECPTSARRKRPRGKSVCAAKASAGVGHSEDSLLMGVRTAKASTRQRCPLSESVPSAKASERGKYSEDSSWLPSFRRPVLANPKKSSSQTSLDRQFVSWELDKQSGVLLCGQHISQMSVPDVLAAWVRAMALSSFDSSGLRT